MSEWIVALQDLKKRNEAFKKYCGFHIGSITMETIEKALKRNEPMKVIVDDIIHGYNSGFCECGSILIDSDNFCSNCGQALNWKSITKEGKNE